MLSKTRLKLYLTPLLIAVLFSVIFSFHSLNRHNSYNSHAFDLGIYAQAAFLYHYQLSPFSTLKQMPILADHFGLILMFLSPLYTFFNDARALLFIQAIFVSLSSIPLYSISLDKLKSSLLALLITLSYLTSQGILSAINFDFHLTTISILPISLMLWSWYFKKWPFYLLTALFCLTFKEDLPIFIFGLGLVQLFYKQKKWAAFSIFLSITSFYLIKIKFMASLWPGAELSYIGTSVLPLSSPADLVLLFFTRPLLFIDQIFNSPLKQAAIETLLKSFAFLPVLSPLFWLTVFPYLFLRFTSTYTALWTNDFHHSANLEPFLAMAAVFTVAKFNLSKKAISWILLFLLALGGLAPSSLVMNSLYLQDSRSFDYINNSLKIIPPDAAVSAQSPIVPHIANRFKIYLFPETKDADYIILDNGLSSYPIDSSQLNERTRQLKQSHQWRVKLQTKSLYIFQKIK